MSQKTCSKCLKKLSLINFHKDNSKPDGLYPSCKSCRRELYGNEPFKPAVPRIDQTGYWKRGSVWVHREIMEGFLQRKLEPNEIVHHINGDIKDNRIENLEVMDRMDHYRHHSEERKRCVFIECNSCGKEKRTTPAYVYDGSSAKYKKNYRCMPCRQEYGWPDYQNI